ncbi:diacylglycerol kinase family protein [Streptomyces sp. NPDC003717]|uniref:diacylglycerol/lipid kinase family protein n=1 Tax=Streptomyces sp. NPDC003717 TaxID=3154276 RepID=UPI0033BB7EF5
MQSDRWAGSGVLITNPLAGAGRADRADLAALTRWCAERVGDLAVVPTGHRGHAEEIAAKAVADGADVVIVAGGDGSTREVAAGLARTGPARPGADLPAVFCVPAGTANSFYREIWSDRPWTRTLDEALSGPVRRVRHVDLAHIEEIGVHALLGTGTGVVADVLAAANRRTDVAGRERYQQAVARVVAAHRPYPARVTVDGEVVHEGGVQLTNIGGGRFRAGQFRLMPHSVLDDGLLDLCVFDDTCDLLELLSLTREGRHVGRPGVIYTRGRHFVVERTDGAPLSLEHDGETAAGEHARCTVGLLAGVVPFLAPPPHQA